MISRTAVRLLVLAYLAWAVVYAVTGRLSDDGLHAYAGRALLEGRRLYLDFEYHQAPLLPHILAGWYRLFGVGMIQARLFALAVSLGVLALTISLARRLGGENAIGWMLLAVVLSPSLALHLGYVQTQGLAVLLALAAVLCWLRGERWEPAAWALAGLAATSRISFVVLALPLAVWGWRRNRRWCVLGLLTGVAVVAAVLGPHWLAGGLAEMLYLPFGAGGNPVTRSHVALYLPSGWREAIFGRLGSWPNQGIYYAPLWLLVAVAWRQRRRDEATDLVLVVALLLTLVHGVLPRRVNHSYLVVAMPFWAALAAGWLGARRPVVGRGWLWLLLAAAVAVGRGVGRVDLSGGRTVLGEIQEVAGRVAGATPADGELFTFAIEFAVAADRDVTPGLEAGYFSYFPNMSRADAERCCVVNEPMLMEILRQRRPAALLLHDGAFRPIARTDHPWPDPAPLWALVEAGYRPTDGWAEVGERRSGLVLWRRR